MTHAVRNRWFYVAGLMATLLACYRTVAPVGLLSVLGVQGDIDLHGFLGLSKAVRPGHRNIRVICRIKSDASHEKLLALSKYVQNTPSVLDIIHNAVTVSVTIEA